VRYQTSVAAAGSLQHEVLGRFEENLRLLQRSFEAGKTSLTEVLIFRREFVDITRSYIETITEAQLAAIAIDLALGALQEQRP
jgi:outer membrane protein TolC